MGFIRDLKRKITAEDQEIQTSWRNADEAFREEKSGELKEAREEAENFKERTGEIVERIEEGLEAFNDYDDINDIQIVEDVAQNFYRSRKRLIENFDPSEDIEEHLEDLEEFLAEFNDVSRKEGEVMKHIRKDAPQLSDSLDELMSHKEDIQDFIDTRYQVVVQLEMVEEHMGELEGLEEDLEEAEEELEGKDTRSIREDIEDLEEKLDSLEETDRWKKLKTLEREEKELEQKKKNKRKEIKSSISEMDRGLKKLIYAIENEGLTFEGDKEKLEKLKDREFDELDEISEELEEALDKIEDEGLVGDRQLEKFRTGVEDLQGFKDLKASIEELEKELADVRESIEEKDVEEEKEELEQSKKQLEKDLSEKKDRIRDLEEKRNRAEEKKQSKLVELEHFMNSLLYPKVEIEEVERD
ncbi:MAG: hypothetical protein ABEK04_00045 [Candidatus Nanohalobium sp.]